MRVADATTFENIIFYLGRAQVRQAELQQQLASGKRITSPSDDPIGFGKAVNYQTLLATVDQRQRGVSTASSQLDQADSSLQTATGTVLARAQELAVAMTNSTNGPTERTADRADAGGGQSEDRGPLDLHRLDHPRTGDRHDDFGAERRCAVHDYSRQQRHAVREGGRCLLRHADSDGGRLYLSRRAGGGGPGENQCRRHPHRRRQIGHGERSDGPPCPYFELLRSVVDRDGRQRLGSRERRLGGGRRFHRRGSLQPGGPDLCRKPQHRRRGGDPGPSHERQRLDLQ